MYLAVNLQLNGYSFNVIFHTKKRVQNNLESVTLKIVQLRFNFYENYNRLSFGFIRMNKTCTLCLVQIYIYIDIYIYIYIYRS
jgi:hypothetical protein